ncbi:MAG: tetratricopeptide repeat protein, partial [Thermoanaerobaculia bacterium]
LGPLLALSTRLAADPAPVPPMGDAGELQEARALAAAGEVDAAYDALRPLAEAADASATVLYEAGRLAAALGRPAAAEAWLLRSLAIEPDTSAVRELGIVLAGAGRYTEAYLLLKPWAEGRPEDAQARRIAALCAVQLRRPSEATVFLADQDPQQPDVRLLWARVRRLEADPWGAIAFLEPLLPVAPPAMATDVRAQLADAYVSVGLAARAVELLAGRTGTDPALVLLLGRARHQGGDVEGALSTLEPVTSAFRAAAEAGRPLPPPGAEILVEYGRVLLAARRSDEALPYLEAATRLQPDDKQGWLQLGQALSMLGRPEEARVALARFQEILEEEGSVAESELRLDRDRKDPAGRELRQALALAAERRFDEALEIADREAALAPGDLRPPLVASRILLLAGRAEEALHLAEQLVARQPDNADAVLQRGAVRLARRELEGAEADFRRVLELSPEHTGAMNALAVLLAERGDEAEARALLERVLALRPDDAAARANLKSLGEP